MLLLPTIAADTPPARAGTVDLQDMARRHEAHWRGQKEESFFFWTPAFVPVLTKRAQSLPGKVVLTVKLVKHVISSSPSAQSSFPSQACSNGMNLTERLQKKYLLSISCLTMVEREGAVHFRATSGNGDTYEEERRLTEEGRGSEDGQ